MEISTHCKSTTIVNILTLGYELVVSKENQDAIQK